MDGNTGEWWRKSWPTLAAVVLVSAGIGWYAGQLATDFWPSPTALESLWTYLTLPRDLAYFRLVIMGLAILFIPFAVAFSARLAKDSREMTAEGSKTIFGRRMQLARHRRFAIQSPIVFLFVYVAGLSLLSLYGFASTTVDHPPYSFWQFWLGSEDGGTSLLATILWLDVLAAIYLWLGFRSYRAAIDKMGLPAYFYPFYVASILLLVVHHGHCHRIASFQPPNVQLFRVHLTDGAPEDGGSRQERLERLEAELRQVGRR